MSPLNTAPRTDDLEHLRLLSIFHYVVAGMMALFALFPTLHLFLGLGMLTGAFPPDATTSPEEAQIVRFMGAFFVAFAGGWILFGLTCAVLVTVAGVYLNQQRKYLFCLIVAGISCMFMPFGTVLGVFTIVVLMRDSVKRLFGRQPAGHAVPG